MTLDKLISIVVVFVLIAASTGQLPRLIFAFQKARVQLIEETKASKWGMPMLLKGDSPEFKPQ